MPKPLLGGLLAALWSVIPAQAVQSVALYNLSQSQFIAENPDQAGKISVYLIQNFQIRPELVANTLRFPTESSVSYAIPAGEKSFTGTLAYSVTDSSGADSQISFNRIRMQVLVDGVRVFDTGMDGNTPPEQFSVPLGTGKVLTIQTSDQWGYDRAYVANPTFTPTVAPLSYSYLPVSGKGYVDVWPQSRESLFHVFRPGEAVAGHAYFRGTATSASVTVKVAPESGASATSSSFQIPLSASSGISSGSFTWTVPSVRGPATATLQQVINGSTVYQTSFRIGIANPVNMSNAGLSPFAVSMSAAGTAFAQDELAASLWGAKWARVFVRWDLVEKVQGQYSWAGLDYFVKAYAQQGMGIIAVLEEATFPAWVSQPGSAQNAALKLFAQLAAARYKGKIQVWELVNEPDNLYRNLGGTGDKDLGWIDSAFQGVRAGDSSAVTSCCATGASSGDFLAYHKRLFDKGYLPNFNIVSMHAYAYRNTPPELNDGPYSFPGRVNALAGLIQRYKTSKPIFVTEANYLIGPPTSHDVNAPGLNEHTQSLYDVRVNLLAYATGVKYFLEMPVFTPDANYLHLDTLSGYATMASFFSSAKALKPLSLGTNGIYAVVGQSGTNLVGALWTTQLSANIALHGISGVQFFDFYGNPISASASDLSLSGTPIYFQASSFNAPSVTLINEVQSPLWQAMNPLMTWGRSSSSSYTQQGNVVSVKTPSMTFSTQFMSTPISIMPNSCNVFDVTLLVQQGAIAWGVIDPATRKWVGVPAALFAYGATQASDVQFRFESHNYSSVLLAITGWNTPTAAVTQFQASQPQHRLCNPTSNGF